MAPQAPLGPAATEFTIRLAGRTREAWFTYDTIGRIETTARKHMGMIVTVFDLIGRPSPVHLAILLLEAIDHEGDLGWGGAARKPSVAKMLTLLQEVANRGEFLLVWKDAIKAIESNFAVKAPEPEAEADGQGERAPEATPATAPSNGSTTSG